MRGLKSLDVTGDDTQQCRILLNKAFKILGLPPNVSSPRKCEGAAVVRSHACPAISSRRMPLAQMLTEHRDGH